MWKFLSVFVFQGQQVVKQYERHVEGGHWHEKKKKKNRSKHRTPTGVKENKRCNQFPGEVKQEDEPTPRYFLMFDKAAHLWV